MIARANNHDWEYNPYEAPRAGLGPSGSPATAPAGRKKALAVTHDLTDEELRRFVNFDVYYDPKPMLGLVPQWVMIAVLAAAAGSGLSLAKGQSTWAAVGAGLALPILALGILDVVAAARRRHARALGLCDGRTATVSPEGCPSRSRARNRPR